MVDNIKDNLIEILYFFRISTHERTLNDLSSILMIFFNTKNHKTFFSLKELQDISNINYKTLSKDITLLLKYDILVKEELINGQISLSLNRKPFETLLKDYKSQLNTVQKLINSF